jgi:hypothetical protein
VPDRLAAHRFGDGANADELEAMSDRQERTPGQNTSFCDQAHGWTALREMANETSPAVPNAS